MRADDLKWLDTDQDTTGMSKKLGAAVVGDAMLLPKGAFHTQLVVHHFAGTWKPAGNPGRHIAADGSGYRWECRLPLIWRLVCWGSNGGLG